MSNTFVASSSMYSSGSVSPPPAGHKTRQVWTAEEDRLLSEAVAIETPKHGPVSWHKVAAHLPGRNNKDCRKRWHYSIVNTIRKGTWTREEDQKLRAAVETYGARWSKIAEAVGTRNGDQCWKRWYDCLDPRIDKSPWTADEDARLLLQVAKHGRNWSDIVHKHFPNRTSLSAKNRYSILQRKKENASKSSSSQRSATGSLASSPSPSLNLHVPFAASTASNTPEPESNPGWQLTEAEIDSLLQQSFTTSDEWYSESMGSASHTPSPQMGVDYEWSSNGTAWGSPARHGFSPSPLHQGASYVQHQSPQQQQQQVFEQLPMQEAPGSGYNMLGVYQSEYPSPPTIHASMYEPMQDIPMISQGGLEYLQPAYGNGQW